MLALVSPRSITARDRHHGDRNNNGSLHVVLEIGATLCLTQLRVTE